MTGPFWASMLSLPPLLFSLVAARCLPRQVAERVGVGVPQVHIPCALHLQMKEATCSGVPGDKS